MKILPRHVSKESAGAPAQSRVAAVDSAPFGAFAAPQPLPLIGRLQPRRQMLAGTLAVAVSLIVAAGSATVTFRQSDFVSRSVELVSGIQMLSQRVAKSSEQAVRGEPGSLKVIMEGSVQVAERMDALEGKGELPPSRSPKVVQGNRELRKAVDQLAASSKQVASAAQMLGSIDTQVANVRGPGRDFAALTEKLYVYLAQNGAAPLVVLRADRIAAAASRSIRNAETILTGSSGNTTALSEFLDDARELNRFAGKDAQDESVRLMLAQASPVLRGMHAELQTKYAEFSGTTDYIAKNAPQISATKAAVRTLLKVSDDVFAATLAARASYEDDIEFAKWGLYFTVLWGLLTVASLALLGLIHNRKARLDTWKLDAWKAELAQREAEKAKNETEESIISIMDELNPIAGGDLTKRLTVSEALTGGIADTVNEVIGSLGRALGRVVNATRTVAQGANRTAKVSDMLAQASARQRAQIDNAVNSVNGMTSSIGVINQSAQQAAEVSRQSALAAQSGEEVVEKNLAAMNVLREYMQEVLKTVKGLGESSQAIGEIVELISEITDQTQVLAVNASLQAAQAGAAGHGFRVVAGEVQRLAERSADSAKRISAMIVANQGETQNAMAAVERSTRSLVDNTAYAERAGLELKNIRAITEQINSRVKEISQATASQAQSAEQVRDIMQGLKQESLKSETIIQASVRTLDEMRNTVQELDTEMGRFKLAAA